MKEKKKRKGRPRKHPDDDPLREYWRNEKKRRREFEQLLREFSDTAKV